MERVMSKSFEKINYSLRVSKAVERKMLCFSFKKLQSFDNIYNYRYIGFGSTFFQDFILFHRDLGIDKMISIEDKEDVKSRFEFNKPYNCIDIKYGNSNAVLPSLEWKEKTILWLDYDFPLQNNFFSDISTFFLNAISGSVFLITINASSGSYGNDNEDRKQKFAKNLGEDKLPYDIKLIDFSPKNITNTLKKIINQEIKKILQIRNSVLPQNEKINYAPLYNFLYQDGALMMTIGGIIYTEDDLSKFQNSNFKSLDFISEDDFFHIKNPSLTLKEIRLLNSQLPNAINETGDFSNTLIINPDIPLQDIIEYAKLYKFFPVFAESFVS